MMELKIEKGVPLYRVFTVRQDGDGARVWRTK